MDYEARIETSYRPSAVHPSHWIVTAIWYGSRLTVFESDPEHHEYIQLMDCLSYVRDLEAEHGPTE